MTLIVPCVLFDTLEIFVTYFFEEKCHAKECKFYFGRYYNSFDLGYHGQENVRINSPNLKLSGGLCNPTTLWNKVMKEVKLGRYAGPYESIPFDSYIQSPIGLVPKDGGADVRLIFHLSYPRGTNKSVNANTPMSMSTTKYPDFSDAIKLCLREGVGCYLARSDWRSAFRQLGISPKFWKYLIMKATCRSNGKVYYFIDKCLPFGAAISCALFQRFSNAIKHIVYYRTKKELVNYLDDFLFAAFVQIVL